jgi:hypothetical protein
MEIGGGVSERLDVSLRFTLIVKRWPLYACSACRESAGGFPLYRQVATFELPSVSWTTGLRLERGGVFRFRRDSQPGEKMRFFFRDCERGAPWPGLTARICVIALSMPRLLAGLSEVGGGFCDERD